MDMLEALQTARDVFADLAKVTKEDYVNFRATSAVQALDKIIRREKEKSDG